MQKSILERIEERKIECLKKNIPLIVFCIGEKGEYKVKNYGINCIDYIDYSSKIFSDDYFTILNEYYDNREPYEEGWEYSRSRVWCKGHKYPVFFGSQRKIISYHSGIWEIKLEALYHKIFPPKEPMDDKKRFGLTDEEKREFDSYGEKELRHLWGL